jgi:hypothetical protein
LRHVGLEGNEQITRLDHHGHFYYNSSTTSETEDFSVKQIATVAVYAYGDKHFATIIDPDKPDTHPPNIIFKVTGDGHSTQEIHKLYVKAEVEARKRKISKPAHPYGKQKKSLLQKIKSLGAAAPNPS